MDSVQVAMIHPGMLHAAQVDGLDVVRLVVAFDEFGILRRHTRKADEFPTHHILVAAIRRVSEKPVLGVREEMAEEGSSGHVLKGDIAGDALKPLQHLILLCRLQLGEVFAIGFSAIAIGRDNASAVQIAG
jgi:hypothetical protein